MPSILACARLLGLKTRDPLALAGQVERGLSFGVFERFRRNTSLSATEAAAAVHIPARTLNRRKLRGRLAPDESDRLVRASRIFGRAVDLFEGDAAAARTWLSTPRTALGGARPIALMGTDVGAREVEDLIGRLEHGVPT